MNTDLAIAVVTSAINDLVATATEAEVSNHSPGAPPHDENPRTGIYLYQVLPNPHVISQDLPTRRGDGSLSSKPRIALDLNYLLSFYGKEAELVPQRLMGAALRALHTRPILSREYISAVIQGDESLKVYDPGECFELIRISPLALSIEEMSKLWSVFFQKPYALSAAYRASVVLIEAEEIPSRARPVHHPDIYVLPMHRPHIERIEAQGGDPRIFTHSTIVVTGRDLLGDKTNLRICDQEERIFPDADEQLVIDLAADRLEINLAALEDLQAGVSGVQVVHAIEMGRPKEDRQVIGSNAAAVVLHPRVDEDENPKPVYQEPPEPPLIRVMTSHPVGIEQRVTLLLNNLEGPGGFSYPAPFRDEVTDQIDFPAPGLKAGFYLVRIQVDGAESEVKYDDSPSPLVVVYAIREEVGDRPEYDGASQKLTLTVDPPVREGQTAKVAIHNQEDEAAGAFTAPSEPVAGESNQVVFHFSDPVEPGSYRITLTIDNIEAINRPEMNIS